MFSFIFTYWLLLACFSLYFSFFIVLDSGPVRSEGHGPLFQKDASLHIVVPLGTTNEITESDGLA